MRRSILVPLAGLAAAASLEAHDLFFRPDSFVASPGARVTVPVLNGTFGRSENAIARERLADLSLVAPDGQRAALDRAAWTERDPRSDVSVTLAGPGTWVLGAATRPRVLGLAGKDFNAYLREEGLDHVLARRKAQGRLDEPSRERYSKSVKVLLQAGDAPVGAADAVLGHEAEVAALENPYAKSAGDTLRVRCLAGGRPLAAPATVFAGGRKAGGEARIEVQRLVPDGDGVVVVRLTDAGAWYVKFVHMEEAQEPDANYVSRWATLTFAVRGRAERGAAR
jgi:uncharacterized GH25 family protein